MERSRPETVLSVVDLPAPFAPIRATISPLMDLEGDVLDGMDRAVVDVDVLDFEDLVGSAIVFTLLLLAQVRLNNSVVALDLLGRTLGDDLTKVKHADALANVHDERSYRAR